METPHGEAGDTPGFCARVMQVYAMLGVQSDTVAIAANLLVAETQPPQKERKKERATPLGVS